MKRPYQAEDIPADPAALIRIGSIVSVDLAAARCVVRYGDPDNDDGEANTPPIRWLTFRAGGTRVWSPPSIGEQVLLLAPDAQIGAAIAVTGIVQDAFPPAGDSTREVIEFGDGARLSYDAAAHALEAILPASATAVIEASGGITLRGDVTIEGDILVEGDGLLSGVLTAGEDVIADGVSLSEHEHTLVKIGTDKSGPPA